MFYTIFSAVITLLGVVLVLLALKVLVRKGWLLGWLRGMAGVLLVFGGVIVVFGALDLYSYKQLVEEEFVATVSFEQLESQRYTAIMVDSDGSEQRYELAGDQWQLDARLIKWPTALQGAGVKPGYRLDRISGRYYSLEEERNAERTVYALNESAMGVDIWESFRGWGSFLNIIDAIYGTATFVPMTDGAVYEVRLSNTGLLARPLNDIARTALYQWSE
ncbi:cation/multidrug efflux pump [Aurantivibrio plasticivorans]